MLRVYHSNRLDVLEALMEFIVERERLDDPFEPEMILVQSTGMAQRRRAVAGARRLLRETRHQSSGRRTRYHHQPSGEGDSLQRRTYRFL